MLRQSESLAPIARIAVQHRERLDGSGYPRASGGGIDNAGTMTLNNVTVTVTDNRPDPTSRATPTAEAS